MSKSEPNGCLFLTDEPEQTIRKIMRASTDCIYGLTYDKINRKNLANLIDIMALLLNVNADAVCNEFKDVGHHHFKETLCQEFSNYFAKLRENYKSMTDEKVINVLNEGTTSASELASNNLDKFLTSIYK